MTQSPEEGQPARVVTAKRPMQLRLVIPRDDSQEARDLRAALLFTKGAYTRAVDQWERLLLELRQDDVLVGNPDGSETLLRGAEWREALVRRVGAKALAVSQEDMQRFYGLIVRSYFEPGAGDTKQAFIRYEPLVTPGSRGGQMRFQVLDHFGWLPGVCLPKGEKGPRVPPEVRARVRVYIEDNPSAARPVGRSPAWIVRRSEEAVRPRANGKPDWYETLLDEVESKQGACEELALGERLADAGLLPVTAPFLPVKAWDRSAFAMAVGHLLSWESMHARMVVAYDEAEEKLRRHEAAGQVYTPVIGPLLERYPGLTFREIRGWSNRKHVVGAKLYEWLRARPAATLEQRVARLTRLQGRSPEDIGSMEVLGWLVRPERQALASFAGGDPVTWLAKRNSLRTHVENARQWPTFTFASERSVRVQLDGPANQNSPSYRLVQEGKILSIDLPLLSSGPNEAPEQRIYRVLLAPSKRLRGLELKYEKKPKGVTENARYETQDRCSIVEAAVGGGFLQIVTSGAGGQRGEAARRAYIQVTMNTKCGPVPAGLLSYFSSALDKRRTKEAPPDGTLLMVVNLGLRTAVGCTVLRWRGPNAPCEHVRSFLLRLPGDAPGAKERERRLRLTRELRAVRTRVKTLADERAKIDALPAGAERAQKWQEYLRAETSVGRSVAALRTRGARRETKGDLSAWRVQHLEDVRRLLISWDRHAVPREAQEGWRGSVKMMTAGIAKRLAVHILALKTDRAKKTADLIVQAALGRTYSGRTRRWFPSKRHVPVAGIIVDGIHNYKQNAANARVENRRLVLWRHREVAKGVATQAALCGLFVGEGQAANTSSYHATTRSPGLRFHSLPQSELSWVQATIANASDDALESTLDDYGFAGWTREQVAGLRPGALQRSSSGEVFVTLRDEKTRGQPLQVNAEINAAQTIGRWYMEGFATPVSLPYVEADEKQQRLIVDLTEEGKARLKGAFPRVSEILLERIADGVYREGKRRRARKAITGDKKEQEGQGGRGNVYRDPSGVFWPADVWVTGHVFWDRVRSQVCERVRDLEITRSARSPEVPRGYARRRRGNQ